MRNIIKINWNEVDWKKIESRVFRIQRRIYKAKTDKKVTAVHYLQKKIIIGFQEKLMSIREASKINKFYWIKTIYINTSKKTIKIAYTSNLKKILILSQKTQTLNHELKILPQFLRFGSAKIPTLLSLFQIFFCLFFCFSIQ
jgi:hypothetical protein